MLKFTQDGVFETRPPKSINRALLDNMSAANLERLTVSLIEAETPWTPALLALAEYVRKEVFS